MAQNKLAIFFILFLNLLSLFSCQNTFHIGRPLPPLPPPEVAEVTKIVENSMIAIQAKSEKFLRKVVSSRLSDPYLPSYSQICMDQCEENYVNAKENIQKVLVDISKKNYEKASEDVDAIVTEIETCYECLNEIIGEDNELKAFDDWVDGVTNDCIAHLERLKT